MSVRIDMHIFIFYSWHSDLYYSVTYVRYFHSSAKNIINMPPNSVVAHVIRDYIINCLFTMENSHSIHNEVLIKDMYV